MPEWVVRIGGREVKPLAQTLRISQQAGIRQQCEFEIRDTQTDLVDGDEVDLLLEESSVGADVPLLLDDDRPLAIDEHSDVNPLVPIQPWTEITVDAPVLSYRAQALESDDLWGYWSLDERSTKIYDWTGNRRPATLNNETRFRYFNQTETPVPYGAAPLWDTATGTAVTISGLPGFTSWTIAFFVRIPATGEHTASIVEIPGYKMTRSGNRVRLLNRVLNFPVDEWVHVFLRGNAGGVSVRINGEYQDGDSSRVLRLVGEVKLGVGSGLNPLHVAYDEIAIWARTMTAEDDRNLYAAQIRRVSVSAEVYTPSRSGTSCKRRD